MDEQLEPTGRRHSRFFLFHIVIIQLCGRCVFVFVISSSSVPDGRTCSAYLSPYRSATTTIDCVNQQPTPETLDRITDAATTHHHHIDGG